MDIAKLPTDNLYIFLTFLGMVLMFLSINYLYKTIQKISEKLDVLERDLTIIKLESESLQGKSKLYDNILKIKEERFEIKYKVRFAGDKSADSTSGNFNLPEHLSMEEVTDFIKDYEDIVNYLSIKKQELTNVRIASEKLKLDSRKIEKLNGDLKTNKGILIFIMFVGLNIAFWGFLSWYDKNQKYQDGIIKAQYEQIQKTKK